LSKEISRLESKDSLALKSEHSAEQVNKDESKVKEETIRFKMDVECSKDFAENFLREYFSSLRGPMERQDPNGTSNVYFQKAMFLAPNELPPPPPNELPPPTNKNRQSQLENVGEFSKWRHKVSISVFLIILISLSTIGGRNYLKNYKNQVSKRARYEISEMNSRLYEAILAQNFDNLLDKLDELTAIPRFRNAHPEITTMSAIARFKRGPKTTEKAKATKKFLLRVKYLFDSWIKRPNDLPVKLRPTEKDIALFLYTWKDTKVLLNQLEAAKQNPVEILSTGQSLK